MKADSSQIRAMISDIEKHLHELEKLREKMESWMDAANGFTQNDCFLVSACNEIDDGCSDIKGAVICLKDIIEEDGDD